MESSQAGMKEKGWDNGLLRSYLSDGDLVVYNQRNQLWFLQQSWLCEGANAESMPTKVSSSSDNLTRQGVENQYLTLKVTYEMKIGKRVSIQPDENYEPSQYSKLHPSEHSTQRTANQQLSPNPSTYSQLQNAPLYPTHLCVNHKLIIFLCLFNVIRDVEVLTCILLSRMYSSPQAFTLSSHRSQSYTLAL
jgi:hypothetical protein